MARHSARGRGSPPPISAFSPARSLSRSDECRRARGIARVRRAGAGEHSPLSGNMCRCGAYPQIVEAVNLAGAETAHRLTPFVLSSRRRQVGTGARPTVKVQASSSLAPGRHGPATHSITSSARERIDCGMVRPSALAVLRLMTSPEEIWLPSPARRQATRVINK